MRLYSENKDKWILIDYGLTAYAFTVNLAISYREKLLTFSR